LDVEPPSNPILDELSTKITARLGNDNLLASTGLVKNNQLWGVGDDYGLTHRYEVRCTLIDRERALSIGHEGQLFTRATAREWIENGRHVVEQEPIEISRLFFEVRPRSDLHLGYGGAAGLRNASREIPGLAMWQQNRVHAAFDAAPIFANRETEGMTPFLEATGFAGARHASGPLTAFAEAGLTISTDPRGIHARALLGAELRLGPLELTASQAATLFTASNFSFETRAGIAIDLDPILIGVELAVPNHAPNRFTRFSDRDPILDLKVEVSL
jgi:hypothetical protein